jgi:hypothetical protein
MTEIFKQAIEKVEYYTLVQQHKKNYIEQYQKNLLFAFQGGLFIASEDLYCFCMLQTLSTVDTISAVLVDSNTRAIHVLDVKVFASLVLDTLTSARNTLLAEQTKLSTIRKKSDFLKV